MFNMAEILIVDDYPDTCRMLTRLIQKVNPSVDCVENGELALHYCQEHDVKLIFLDWMMPGLTGLEFLYVLRANENFATVSVVMFSALSDEVRKERAIQAGAQDFIVKGKIDEVLTAVNKYTK